MYKEFKSPLSVQLELTANCSHKCVHCYNHWREEGSSGEVLSEKDLIVIIRNLRESEVASLLITGGEPMLYPDLMIKALKLGKQSGFKCSLNSNLAFITSKIARELKKLNVSVLTSVLSYDEKMHDKISGHPRAFKKVMSGIKILQKYEIPISANMVVMKENLSHIYKTGKLIHSMGVKSFSATKVHPAQGCSGFDNLALTQNEIVAIFDDLIRLKDHYGINIDSLTTYPVCLFGNLERYGDLLSKRNCSAGKTGCTIGASGQVRPCGHADEVYGNAISESLLDIWPRLKKWRDGSLLPRECKECEHFAKCSGGCRMDCKFYGKIDSLDPCAKGKDFKFLPMKPKKQVVVDLSHTLLINPKLHFRKESFGEVLLLSNHVKSIVTHDSAELLRKLTGEVFTFDQVLEQYRVKTNIAKMFFIRLIQQDIILIV